MIYRSRQKTVVIILTDEPAALKAVEKTSRRLEGYELKMVKEVPFAVLKVYIDMNTAPQEQNVCVSEIFGIFEEELKKANRKSGS